MLQTIYGLVLIENCFLTDTASHEHDWHQKPKLEHPYFRILHIVEGIRTINQT